MRGEGPAGDRRRDLHHDGGNCHASNESAAGLAMNGTVAALIGEGIYIGGGVLLVILIILVVLLLMRRGV
jgi:hypothetical protein